MKNYTNQVFKSVQNIIFFLQESNREQKTNLSFSTLGKKYIFEKPKYPVSHMSYLLEGDDLLKNAMKNDQGARRVTRQRKLF